MSCVCNYGQGKLHRWLRGKESAYNAGEVGVIPGSGRSPEKEMASHSSMLAWEIPLTEEPSRLQIMGSEKNLTLNNNNKGKLQEEGIN